MDLQDLKTAAQRLIDSAQAVLDENERRRNQTLGEWLAENMKEQRNG